MLCDGDGQLCYDLLLRLHAILRDLWCLWLSMVFWRCILGIRWFLLVFQVSHVWLSLKQLLYLLLVVVIILLPFDAINDCLLILLALEQPLFPTIFAAILAIHTPNVIHLSLFLLLRLILGYFLLYLLSTFLHLFLGFLP